MFQRIFYSNNPLQYWIVLLLGLFGMILNLLYVEQDASINSFVFPELFSNVIIKAKYAVVLSYIFLFISTLELIHINKDLSDTMGVLLPSVVLTLFFNILFPSVYSIIGIIILPVFIFITRLLINVSEHKRIFSELFYIGFISGFISMINFDFVIILFIVYIGLAFLRPFYFKEYIVLLISFLLPYIMLDSVMFFFFDTHVIRFLNIKNNSSFNDSVFSSLLFAILVLIISTIFVYLRILNQKVQLKKLKSRKIFIWINSSIFLVWIWIFLSSKLLLIYLLTLLLAISFSVILMSLPKQIHSKLLLI
ncbi:MAG: hypothetical protein ACUVQP_05330, partial [Bacteroidales bacterium]